MTVATRLGDLLRLGYSVFRVHPVEARNRFDTVGQYRCKMAESERFKPTRDQDAWATLRGFRYQVDLSILRWLALQTGQYLELERGEDIDLVGQALTSHSDQEFARILEQVKVRTNSLTLRSSSAL